jgi:hypothetical protein
LIPWPLAPANDNDDEGPDFELLQFVDREDELILPTNGWTGLFQLNTSPAAQMWFMIHHHLQGILVDPTGINR